MSKNKKGFVEKNKSLIIIVLLMIFVYYMFSSGLVNLQSQTIVNNTYNTENNTIPQSQDVVLDTQENVVDDPVFDWSFLFIPLNTNTCDDHATQIGYVWYPNSYNAAGGTNESCDIVRGACKLYPPKGFFGNVDNLFCCSYDKMCYEYWEVG
jgi:hypothetical protein